MNVIGVICRMLGVKGSCWKQDTLADIGVGGVSLILEGRLGIVLDGSLASGNAHRQARSMR